MTIHDEWKKLWAKPEDPVFHGRHYGAFTSTDNPEYETWINKVERTGGAIQAKLEAIDALITHIDDLQAKIKGTEGAEYRTLFTQICSAQTTMYKDVKELLGQ